MEEWGTNLPQRRSIFKSKKTPAPSNKIDDVAKRNGF
jgi:hypothetical protein